MDKKAIQRERIKNYFIEAAQEIIEKEGVEAVSVRKVADIAGYSYATLYNYFDDLDELLWQVAMKMLGQLVSGLQQRLQKRDYTIEDFRALLKFYMKYHINHPNIFRFFFIYNGLNKKEEADEQMEQTPFTGMLEQVMESFVQQGVIFAEDIKTINYMITYSLHGLLLFMFSSNTALSENEALESLDLIIDYIMNQRKELR